MDAPYYRGNYWRHRVTDYYHSSDHLCRISILSEKEQGSVRARRY